jgi:hypothetical protein
MPGESSHHLYSFLEGRRKGFNKIASVTGRHVRPLLLLCLEDASFCKSASFLVLKASKHFLGSWKMYLRGQTVKEKRSFPLTFS